MVDKLVILWFFKIYQLATKACIAVRLESQREVWQEGSYQLRWSAWKVFSICPTDSPWARRRLLSAICQETWRIAWTSHLMTLRFRWLTLYVKMIHLRHLPSPAVTQFDPEVEEDCASQDSDQHLVYEWFSWWRWRGTGIWICAFQVATFAGPMRLSLASLRLIRFVPISYHSLGMCVSGDGCCDNWLVDRISRAWENCCGLHFNICPMHHTKATRLKVVFNIQVSVCLDVSTGQERFTKKVKESKGWKCKSLSAARHRQVSPILFAGFQTFDPIPSSLQ